MSVAWAAAAAVCHVALWVEVVNRAHGLLTYRPLVKAITAACGLALVGIPVGAAATAWAPASAAPAAGWLGVYSVVSVAVGGAVIAMRGALRFDPLRDRRADHSVETEVVDVAARRGEAATGSRAIWRAARAPGNQLLLPRVERRTLALDRLPAALEGLRIAHLTDLHMSPRMGAAYYEEVVRVANDAAPDLVCLTGDLVEHPSRMEWVESILGRLRGRLGVFFVLGNHDKHVDVADLRARLEAVGLADAGRETHRLGDDAAGLVVCGDERPWFPAGPAPPRDAAPVLALLHTPDRFAWAVDAGVDLALAGHNHGGQVRAPIVGPILCPSRHGVRFASGTFRSGRTVMHVSRGAGSLFPFRYACPPEVAVLTLTRGA